MEQARSICGTAAAFAALLAGGCGKTAPSAPIAVSPSTSAPSARFADRPFQVRVPRNYDPAVPAPLVIALHPLGGTGPSGAQFAEHWGLDRLADAKGLLLVAPDGTTSPEGRFWNATDACCDFHDAGVDDSGYLSAIIDDVSARFRVDAKRVYVVGYSSGAAMAHRIACDDSAKIAAVVSMAGAVWKDPSRCNPSTPVAVVEVHGNADEVVHYEGGGPVRPGMGVYPGAAETVAIWARKNGCTGALAPTSEVFHFDARRPAAETRVARYQGCPAGGDIELWTMDGTGHYTDLLPAWTEAMLQFLATHPKP